MNDNTAQREALHPEEALALILSDLPAPSREILPLGEALDRVLASDLRATTDQPPFDKSAMDGYAYGEPATDGLWRLVAMIPAGSTESKRLEQGECAAVMTGAAVPGGTVAVRRREYCIEEAGFVRFTVPENVDNIVRRGENLRSDDLLLTPRRLRPQDIGIIASSGYSAVPVAVRPRVGVVSTGDELVECGADLGRTSIYDSNGPQIAAQASALGCEACFYGIVADDPKRLAQVIGRALAECDVTIVSGAVSMGNFDFVPRTLAELGVREVFHGLKMRPGKPTFYGRFADKSVFGLPGNPVSTFVNFEVFVRPHLLRRMGITDEPIELALPLAAPLARRGSDRQEYLPGRIETPSPAAGGRSCVRPLAYRGSSMLSALAGANCLMRMEIGVESIPEGGLIHARLIRP